MPVNAGVVYVDIAPQVAKTFGTDLEKQVTGPVEDSGKRVGSSLTKVAGLIGGAFAAKGIFDFGKASIEAATESAKITAQTEAVIKSTGNAAKVTAGQIGDLAGAIAAKTGIDDEAIQEGENLLLTFTNIRNEVGKGNDVFNQATKIAVDMGAALGTDASSQAIQLGKALNDPIKGVTALSRVGVTFTDQQKDQIKALVDSGKTMDAQKIILGELNKEFGGSAEAQATAGDRLKVVWGNVQEQIGGALLPIFEKVATFVADNLPKAIDAAGRAFTRFKEDYLPPLVAFFQDVVVPAFDKVATFVRDNLPGALKTGQEAFNSIKAFVQDSFMPVFERVWSFIQDNLKPILIGLGIILGLLVAPFITVAGALIFAYLKFELFRTIVDAVVAFFRDVVIPAVAKLASFIIEQFGNLVAWVQQYWPQISEAIGHVLDVIEGIVRTAIDVVSALWRQWGDDLLRLIQTAWDYIKGTIDNALQVIRGIIATVVALINGDWGKAWDGIKQVLAGIWDQITNVVSTAIEGVKGILGGLASTMGELFKGAADKIVEFLLSIPGRIANLGKDILSKLIPDIPGGGVLKSVLGKLPGFANGGIVTQPTLAWIGEKEAEAVIPLSQMGSGGLGGPQINQTFYAAAMDPNDVAVELDWLFRTRGR